MNFKKTLLAASVAALIPFSLPAAELSFSYDGKNYSGNSLPPAIQGQLFELETQVNQQRREIIDQYVLEKYVVDLAKEQDKSAEEVARGLMQVPEPSEEALRQFYDENWQRIQMPFEEVKDQLGMMVRQQQQQKKLDELLAKIKEDKQYSITISGVEAPQFDIKTAGYPTTGTTDAPVVVHEFSDFQCPHCKNAAKEMHEIVEELGAQMQLVFRYMPINPSGISRKIAEGGVCAEQQGKFWEYQDLAFDNQSQLQKDSPLAFAKELGLDEEQFADCFADEKTAALVQASEDEGRELGVSGTPSFFVNGVPFTPENDLMTELKAAIEAASPETAKATESAAKTDEQAASSEEASEDTESNTAEAADTSSNATSDTESEAKAETDTAETTDTETTDEAAASTEPASTATEESSTDE